jgi:hypothetical protein
MDADDDPIARLRDDGDDRAAFSTLRTRLAWPAGKAVALAELPRWLDLLAELSQRGGSPELAELAAAAVKDLDSPDRLYDLGYALIDAGVPELAASILWRCLGLVGESEEVVCELVAALERALAYRDALGVLLEHPQLRTQSFLCRYLYAFNAAMAGRLELTREILPRLAPDTPEAERMAHTIGGIVGRADRLAGIAALDERDLRGWHYVLTGGLLLHQSPYGFAEPMHGRFAYLVDSLPRIATGLERLAPLVRGLALPCIYAPPGRGHAIVAAAASARLGIPVAPWPAVGVPAPGLVVLHDLATLAPADVVRLAQRRPDQVLYAHASPWTQDSPVAPDVTMLLYQTIVAPWDTVMTLDPETRQVGSSAPDEREVDAIAAEIAASPGLEADELEADEPARWDALVAAAWPLENGARARLWAGSPVPSSWFR